jgi:hypothetical protein
MAQLPLRTRRSAESAPRTFAEAHFQGMETTTDLRQRLGCKVKALIAISRGDVDQVAAALGMLPWKVRQIAEGTADPTLGEVGRIANTCGESLEIFIAQLLIEATPVSTVFGSALRQRLHRRIVQGDHGG